MTMSSQFDAEATNLTSLNLKKPDQTTIEHMEHLLEKARAGEVRSIVYVVEYWDGCASEGYRLSPMAHRTRILGGITLLQHRLVKEINEEE